VCSGDVDLRINSKARVLTITAVRRHLDELVCSCYVNVSMKKCDGHCGPAPALTSDLTKAHPHCPDCEKKNAALIPAQPIKAVGCCGHCTAFVSAKATVHGDACTERFYGSLIRELKMPVDADLTKVHSTLHRGVLTVRIGRYLLPHTAAAPGDHEQTIPIKELTDAAIRDAAAIAADPNRLQNVLFHHVTVPANVNPVVQHMKVDAQIKANAGGGASADPVNAEIAGCKQAK